MNKNKYPVVMAQSVKGTNFHHSGVYTTLYFKIYPDEKRYNEDNDYHEYMDFIKNEPYDAITNKFLLSIPTRITNDNITLLLFKSNIDINIVKQFCIAMLDEIDYFTGTEHKADYFVTDTILLQIGKSPSLLKASKIGDKLTQTDQIEKEKIILKGDKKNADSGILTPFDIYLYDKKKKENELENENEEIVSW